MGKEILEQSSKNRKKLELMLFVLCQAVKIIPFHLLNIELLSFPPTATTTGRTSPIILSALVSDVRC